MSGVPQRILVTRLRYLGDVILTTPVIDAIGACFPGAEIWYMAERPHLSVVENHPGLSGVIEAGGTLATAARLRRMRFDVAIDLFYNPRSANILFLSGIPVRVGGGRKWRRRLYTHIFDPRGAEGGAIGHHLSAVRSLGCEPGEGMTRIFLTDEERAAGEDAAVRAFGGVMPARAVAMHPGGTWPAKRWAPSSFAELADMISERFGARTLILTGPGQEDISMRVASQAGRGAAVLPIMPIRAASSAMAACSAVVANDGGVMHAAVALGMPTVGIFGPTEPEIWFPYTGKGPWEVVTSGATCAPCHLHECPDMRCLTDISAGDAAGALARVTGWHDDE